MSSTELKKYSKDGKESGSVQVNESVFGMEKPNQHVLHLAVLRELANGRAGTASTKTRSEVRGGGRKPWKQKGTGRARAGSIRSPLWAGGGIIFGPKPRSFAFNLPKKVRRLAICSSLSASKDKIRVLPDFSFLSAPKTKEMAAVLKGHGLYGQKVLILANYKADENQHVLLAARNIKGVQVSLPTNLSARTLLNVDAVLATESAIQEINERYAGHG